MYPTARTFRILLLAAISMTAGCGKTSELPTTYRGEFLQIKEGQPEAEDARVVLGTVLTSEGGTDADIQLSFSSAPPGEGRSVRCGGRTFQAAGILDQSKSATGTIRIEGEGTLRLDVQRDIGVLGPAEDAPPVCDEWSGTWTGTGHLEGRTGTFRLVGFHEEESNSATLSIEENE